MSRGRGKGIINDRLHVGLLQMASCQYRVFRPRGVEGYWIGIIRESSLVVDSAYVQRRVRESWLDRM